MKSQWEFEIIRSDRRAARKKKGFAAEKLQTL